MRHALLLATAAAIALVSVPALGTSDRGSRGKYPSFRFGDAPAPVARNFSRPRGPVTGHLVSLAPGGVRDASSMPEPTGALLFGSGALTVVWMTRRYRGARTRE
jgi:hypothetical protein